MLLIGNTTNNRYIRSILPSTEDYKQITNVLAAVAYGQSFNTPDNDLVKLCKKHKLRLDLWMRHDHTVPVGISLLHELNRAKHNNIFSSFVKDVFHPKVIWWKGYGAYIGSANLTERAWNKNIEAGIFFTEDDLTANKMDVELHQFFSYLETIDDQHKISDEYVALMEKYNKLNRERIDKAKQARERDGNDDFWEGPDNADTQKSEDRKRKNFQRSWSEVNGYLDIIKSQVVNYRPAWIAEEIPAAWQADQFLHAYYYTVVREGNSHPYEEFHQRNQADPAAELNRQLHWWSQQPVEEMVYEHQTLVENSPLLKQLFSPDSILNLSNKDFAQALSNVHATRLVVRQLPAHKLGRATGTTIPIKERFELFSPFILSEKNAKGWDIRKLLHYVLYEKNEELWQRVYNASRNPDYSIPYFDVATFSEIAGWVRHDIMTPRNGRTSKALSALGYPVDLRF